MVSDGYFIDGYWCLLTTIIWVAVGGYFIGGYYVIRYWWLLMVIILVAIGGY